MLRHDVDLSLDDAVSVASVEAQLDITSTYFIRVSASRYDVTSRRGVRLLRQLVDMGHEIGLHFDTPQSMVATTSITKQLRDWRHLLESAAGVRVRGGTIHLPRRVPYHPTLDDLVASGLEYDPGSPEFNDGALFFSDSRREWDHGCPCTYLGHVPHIYAIFHPYWWCHPDVDVHATVNSLRNGV
jgi:hypothetical protein